VSIEIAARTKIDLTTDSGDMFPAGTDVLLLEQVGDEWFTEFVIEDSSRLTGKRWAYMMVAHGDLDISQ
jgi:hypothetical protein